MRSLPIMFSSGSVHSSLGIKGISITIFRLKFIFVWISLMPQPIGNVLNWDFVLIFFHCLPSFELVLGSSYNLI